MLSHSGNSLAALFRRLNQYTQRCLYDQPGLPPANKKTTKSNQALTYSCNLRMPLTKKASAKETADISRRHRWFAREMSSEI